jgi:hypothetical protein
MTGTWHSIWAGSAVLAASLVGSPSARADDPPAPVHYPTAVTTAEREWVYARLRRRLEEAHREIPAFARKYGMKCSACHFAAPVLNSFGLAFKDNGYRMKVGTDDLRLKDPGYWPAFAWLWKNYQLDVERVGGQTVQRRGRIADGAVAFGGLGSISDKISFRFVPIIYEDGFEFLDAGWVRYNQALGSDWLNIRLGAGELDLPIGAGRDHNMSTPRFALMYAYSVPGSVPRFNLFGAPTGIELMGHDRGSRNRYTLSVFNSSGAPEAHCTFCAPSVFGRVTHRRDLPNGFLRSVQLGAFGTYATWAVGPDTSDLKGQQRLGADLEFVLGSDVLPLRVTAMAMTGRDDRELVELATTDPKFNAGMLQLEYVPSLSWVFYSRLQLIRNQRQAVAGRPDDFGDQDFQFVGAHYYPDLTSRFGWWLELSYSRQLIKRATPTGENATHHFLWAGAHLVF